MNSKFFIILNIILICFFCFSCDRLGKDNYIGQVTAYSFHFNGVCTQVSTKEIKLEKHSGEICAVMNDKRYHVIRQSYQFSIKECGSYPFQKKDFDFNASCTIDGKIYYFNY